LEVIFASLRPPGTPLVSWFTPGGPQDPPRRVWERLLGPSGADFGPTWRELDFSSLKNAFFFGGHFGRKSTHLGANLPPESPLEQYRGLLEVS